jgi:hypothetical protein
MLRTIDRHNGVALQKVTTPNGKLLRFQLVHEAALGNTEAVRHFQSLSAARQAGGWPPCQVAATTKPKTAYPQNNKGFRADRR